MSSNLIPSDEPDLTTHPIRNDLNQNKLKKIRKLFSQIYIYIYRYVYGLITNRKSRK